MSHPLVGENHQTRFEVGGISKQIHDNQYDVIVNLVRSCIHPNMQTLEIGSWTGLSAVLIGQPVQRMKGVHHCVDWFQGTVDNDGHLKETSEKYDIKNIFLSNISFFNLNDTINLKVMKSEEAVKHFTDNSLDFIFIDGDHNTEAVIRDINWWFPKLKLGKYISGHDYLACQPALNTISLNVEVNSDIWYARKRK